MKQSRYSAILLFLILLGLVALHNESQSDADSDGIADAIDNCVHTYNPNQYDRDGDNRGHACDHNVFLRSGVFDPIYEKEIYIPDITVSIETGYYFVQLEKGYDHTYLQLLFRKLRCKHLDTFDGDTYIIKTKEKLHTITQYKGIRAAGIYQPANRIEPKLFLNRYINSDGSLIRLSGYEEFDIYVYDNIEELKNKLRAFGVDVLVESDKLLSAKVPLSNLLHVICLPEINLINPKSFVQTENYFSNSLTHVDKVNTHHGLTGEGEVIVIADTGLDSGDMGNMHPDLADSILNIEIRAGISGVDLTGHGTHVAGIAVGSGKASNGKMKGVAPAAKLIFQAIGFELPEAVSQLDDRMLQRGAARPLPLNCFGNDQADMRTQKPIRISYTSMNLDGLPLDYTELFNGHKIHSNSWGSCQGIYSPKIADIDHYLWKNKESVVLFAAGNDADFVFSKGDELYQQGGDSLSNTARSKNAIIVGATESSRVVAKNSGDSQKVAVFSSKGSEQNGRVKPDIVAPGRWILSARSRFCLDGLVNRTETEEYISESKTAFTHEKCVAKGLPSKLGEDVSDDLYVLNSGTSMATPHVAGLVALTREYFKKYKSIDNPSAALIKAVLINGAVDLKNQGLGLKYKVSSDVSCEGYPNMCEGWGLVNIEESLFPGDDHEKLWFRDTDVFYSVDDIFEFELEFPQETDIKITLCWTDSPPELLQNDLDLIIVSPSKKTYLGNTFVPTGVESECNPKSKDFRLNNNVVEKIIIRENEAGLYKVIVTSNRIITDQGQPFALVASGVAKNSIGN